MRRARFSFSRQRSEAFGYIARPMITVTMRAIGGEPFDITALFDSGADISMFSPSVARILGVKIRSGERKVFRGLGGKVKAHIHRIRFNIGALDFYARVAFPNVEIPNIIGRLDVMKDADVTLRDERELSIELSQQH